jgi:hypothetical protein
MHHPPFLNQAQSPPGERSFHDATRAYFDRRLKFAISRMKMWWLVIIKEHANQNSIKRAYRWHLRTLISVSPQPPVTPLISAIDTTKSTTYKKMSPGNFTGVLYP